MFGFTDNKAVLIIPSYCPTELKVNERQPGDAITSHTTQRCMWSVPRLNALPISYEAVFHAPRQLRYN